MTGAIQRVRMFAGPNGSGKSTLFRELRQRFPEVFRSAYLNPDEIEEDIRRQGCLDFGAYGISTTTEEVLAAFRASPLVAKAGMEATLDRLRVADNRLQVPAEIPRGYLGALITDFLRHRLLEAGTTFTFETVMSSPDKVEFLRKAQAAGYRTYLYYVATDDPEINESRVRNRIGMGGHAVSPEKIAPRYHRSLGLLPDAIRASSRAYIFDNSGGKGEHTSLAEVTDGRSLELKTDVVPAWFKKAVLDAFKTR